MTHAVAASLALSARPRCSHPRRRASAQSKDDKKHERRRRRRKSRASSRSSTMRRPVSPAPNDLALAWVREDLLKAQGNKQYVPFTVDDRSVEGHRPRTSRSTGASSRRTPAAGGPPTPNAQEGRQEARQGQEDRVRLRGHQLRAGDAGPEPDADLAGRSPCPPAPTTSIVVVKEPTPEKAPKNAPPPKISLIKQTRRRAGLLERRARHELGDRRRADRSAAGAADAAAADRAARTRSARWKSCRRSSTKFTKKAELSTFMLIYNPKIDSANKPDVSVEYNFYAKQAGAPEKFFNKTNPQNLNAPDAAAAVRSRRGPSAAERSGRAAGVVPRRRLPARDQGHRQDREQDADAGRELLGRPS